VRDHPANPVLQPQPMTPAQVRDLIRRAQLRMDEDDSLSASRAEVRRLAELRRVARGLTRRSL
jgi:predicted outer membrane protein